MLINDSQLFCGDYLIHQCVVVFSVVAAFVMWTWMLRTSPFLRRILHTSIAQSFMALLPSDFGKGVGHSNMVL